MEAIISSQAVETDVLPPNLSYAPDPTGSFVLAKREATVFALGSSYSPNGVKMIQIPFPLMIHVTTMRMVGAMRVGYISPLRFSRMRHF